jgi:hypothetical protein
MVAARLALRVRRSALAPGAARQRYAGMHAARLPESRWAHPWNGPGLGLFPPRPGKSPVILGFSGHCHAKATLNKSILALFSSRKREPSSRLLAQINHLRD